MAKRFIDTEFFKRVRGFEGPYKLLYIFIICDCDSSGIWNPDFEVASIYVGSPVSADILRTKLAGKFQELPNGQWFFPGFIKHQYPAGLQNTNPAHKKIIEKLKMLGLIGNDLKLKTFEGALKDLESPYVKPSNGTMVMVKVEDKVEVKVVKAKKEKLFSIVLPWDTVVFYEAWQRWKDYKEKQHKYKFKSEDIEQTTLNDLRKKANGDEIAAVEIIQQSIANGWKGFFEIKNNQHNGNQTNQSLFASKLGTSEAQIAALRNY